MSEPASFTSSPITEREWIERRLSIIHMSPPETRVQILRDFEMFLSKCVARMVSESFKRALKDMDPTMTPADLGQIERGAMAHFQRISEAMAANGRERMAKA